jgi:hypothetical protein
MEQILTITGNVSIANSDATLLGKGTNFTTDLKIGDSISFTNDAGNTVTGLVKYIVSQTELELTANVGGSDVTTASVLTEEERNLQIQKIIFQYSIYHTLQLKH